MGQHVILSFYNCINIQGNNLIDSFVDDDMYSFVLTDERTISNSRSLMWSLTSFK